MTRSKVSVGVLFALVLATAAEPASPPALLSSRQVLERIEVAAPANPAAVSQSQSAGAVVMRDINAFRDAASTQEPRAAALHWFELYDRTVALGATNASNDFELFDVQTMQSVSRDSLLYSLPPPAAWAALRQEAARRASAAPADREALSLRLLAELLDGDRKAATQTLTALDHVIASLPPEEQMTARVALSTMRTRIVRTYGSAAEIAASFADELRDAEPYMSIEIPDLVGLVGADESKRLITQALRSGSALSSPSGDATRKLVRELALENIERMKVAQWDLADSIDSRLLFEAMEKRFDHTAVDADTADAGRVRFDYQKQRAAAWYFLGAVIEGRQADAERALARMSGDQEIYLPHEAVDALRKAGQEKALYQFLAAQLERRPQLRAWDIFVREAAFSGHSQDALALLDRVIARKDISDFLAADLRVRRIGALLAADRVNEASKAYRAMLAKPPVRGDATLKTRYDAALAAAAVGRLASDAALNRGALDFAIAAYPLLMRNESMPWQNVAPADLWRELRVSGRGADAQVLVLAELVRAGTPSGFMALANHGSVDVAPLVELAGLWSDANAHADVLRLLSESTRWGVDDAGTLLAIKDSRETPFGVIIARALRATGDADGASRVARATLSQLPGNDSAFEIVAALDGHAAAMFDSLFALDPFEERPLIWKARVQLDAGALGDAESTIRKAIAIDPSDGEQGVNDRMRAYAVLSELLAKRGDAQGAATYSGAVRAIRMSEHADQLHAAGLYERAFKEYRAALEQFSDAYCIQSRLAVQLQQQGRRAEALEHYRRAYELMPDSFGRVESHCFGCESVFQGEEAQSIAERVFEDFTRKTPAKPQAYYLLAYLREQQERPADALAPLRKAVSIDPQYLNAWSHLANLGEHVYVEPWELDNARLRLLELDPLARHVRYEVSGVGDLPALWRTAERARATAIAARPERSGVFALRASAAAQTAARAGLPPEMTQQITMVDEITKAALDRGTSAARPVAVTLGSHQLVQGVRALLGMQSRDY